MGGSLASLLPRAVSRARRALDTALVHTVGRLKLGDLDPPVLVLGCGHSGTTLLARLLDCHSAIWCPPRETRMFLSDAAHRERWIRYLDRKTALEGKRRWAEKTPRHVQHVKTALERLPHARILLLHRDGRDVAVSLAKRYQDRVRATRRWRNDVTAGLEWIEHPAVHTVRYEDIVRDSEPTLRAALAFLGEEFEGAVLHPEEQPWRWAAMPAWAGEQKSDGMRPGFEHSRSRQEQVRKPIYDGSGKWRTEMDDDFKDLFKREAGELLIRLGYATDDTW